jgi:arginase family enzyme
MAVTIDEMHVDVREASAPAAAPATEADPNKGLNLREAMQLMRQRTERLQAD